MFESGDSDSHALKEKNKTKCNRYKTSTHLLQPKKLNLRCALQQYGQNTSEQYKVSTAKLISHRKQIYSSTYHQTLSQIIRFEN